MSFLVGVCIFGAVTLVIISLNMILKKETDISKFSGNWEGDSSNNNTKTIKKKIKIKPITLVLTIGGSITGYIILFIVTGMASASIIGLFIGFIIPKLLSDSYIKKQRNLTIMQIEQSAEIMSSVLRSGSGIVDSLVRAATEVNSPFKEELLATANEIRLGVPNAIAFSNLADRVNYDELRILSMAINLQQEGMAVNLSSLLSQIQESVRYKISFQRDVNVITAENRMAGWIVAVLPFATLAVTRIIMPDIVAPLFNTTIGLIIFGFCVVTILIGVFWLMKIAQIDV